MLYIKNSYISIFIFITFSIFFLLPKIVLAQVSVQNLFDPNYGHVDFAGGGDNDFLGMAYAADFGLPGSDGSSYNLDLRETLINVLRYIMSFMAIIALSMILLAGFKFMIASGNEESIANAKRTLVSGIIGLVIILTSYTIVGTVVSTVEKLAQGTF